MAICDYLILPPHISPLPFFRKKTHTKKKKTTASLIILGSDIRATPLDCLISAGIRSKAITAQAPASSAIFACSLFITSMMTPPFNIAGMPFFTRLVPSATVVLVETSAMLTKEERRRKLEQELSQKGAYSDEKKASMNQESQKVMPSAINDDRCQRKTGESIWHSNSLSDFVCFR